MIRIAIISFLLFFQVEVPFKPKDAFEIKFELSFKARSNSGSQNTFHLDETVGEEAKRTSNDPLPYLKLNVKILNVLPEEVRIKVTRDNKIQLFNKKIDYREFKLDVGFTDDIKDGVSGYMHVIEFLSEDKKTVSKIVIEFDREGNYMVNGEKRGKI
jgi:hypothetical protein